MDFIILGLQKIVLSILSERLELLILLCLRFKVRSNTVNVRAKLQRSLFRKRRPLLHVLNQSLDLLDRLDDVLRFLNSWPYSDLAWRTGFPRPPRSRSRLMRFVLCVKALVSG